MLAAAKPADAQKDETHGTLEAEAKAAAEEQRDVETAALAEREAEGRQKPGKPAALAPLEALASSLSSTRLCTSRRRLADCAP
jgi:hypothetical protein